jgi:hypothetical protein
MSFNSRCLRARVAHSGRAVLSAQPSVTVLVTEWCKTAPEAQVCFHGLPRPPGPPRGALRGTPVGFVSERRQRSRAHRTGDLCLAVCPCRVGRSYLTSSFLPRLSVPLIRTLEGRAVRGDSTPGSRIMSAPGRAACTSTERSRPLAQSDVIHRELRVAAALEAEPLPAGRSRAPRARAREAVPNST